MSRIKFRKSRSKQNDFIIPTSKRIAFCEKKKFALLHQSATSGEEIAILYGSRVPVVVRRVDEGYYSVIGQCYYEDAMYGEAVTWEREDADTFILV
jgi:hypothetical protein